MMMMLMTAELELDDNKSDSQLHSLSDSIYPLASFGFAVAS